MPVLRDYITSIVPAWLTRPAARGLLTSFGDEADGVAADALDAVEYGRIEECASDGLTPHLRNSNLQVVAGESAALQRTTVRGRWLQWRESGGKDGMVRALARVGCPNAEIWSTLDLLIAGAVNPFGLYQGFFFVVIKQPHIFTSGYRWKVDGKHYRDGTLWGLGGGTRSQLEDILFTIRKFKPAVTSCRFVTFDLGLALPRVIPMREPWEYDPETGRYRSFYNYSYLVP